LKTQRRICLRVASGYCTVSGEAAEVISGITPLDLMAIKRKNILDLRENTRMQHIDKTLLTWQNRWNNNFKGGWI